MNSSIAKITAATIAVVSAVVVAVPSFAEGPSPGPGGPEHMQRPHALPSERIEARLAYAKVALKITDAQARQWNAVADVLRKQAKQRDAEMQAMMQNHRTPGTAPDLMEMLQHRQQQLTAAAAAQAELLAAAKPLYATLSDDQKIEAAYLLMPHRGGRGFGRM